MKKSLYGISCLLLVLIFISCQKELSLERGAPSAGSLKSDATGDCLNKTVDGTYIAGKTLGDTNFIEVEVEVSQPGSYTIFTDTVNGYSFKGTGNFNSAGLNKIKLTGSGNPEVEGVDQFVVIYDTSICLVEVPVFPASVTGTPANFTLTGAPGNCGNFQTAGNFVKSVALTSANKVSLNVAVTTAGTYTISTNTVNGYSFSGSGVLAAGAQTINLIATGTPLSEGINVFTVTVGASTCTFSVTVTATAPPPAASGVYFPLTQNSWWSYNDPASAGDTIKRINLAEASGNNNTYREVGEVYEDGDTAFYYFRKADNDYFEYTAVDNYSILTFDGDVEGDILFLKEGLTTGTTWSSAEFSGTEGGTAKKLKYVFTCTDAAGTASIGGKNFNEVYKITFKPQVSTGTGAFMDEGVIWDAWYAKGIGLIYLKAGVAGTSVFEMSIKNWLVL